MRLLHIITDLHVGGAETMLLRLLQTSSARGMEPAVIALLPGGEVAARIAALGIPVQALGLRRAIVGPGAVTRLSAEIRRLNPDVVQTWMYHADLLGGLAARLAANPPLVWGVHNTNLDPRLTKGSTRAVVRACALLSHMLPRRIISCSEVAVPVHRRLGYAGCKFTVIPNGFDTEVFRPDALSRASVRHELGIDEETLLVGLVARFDPQKDHANFIRAASLSAASADVRFVLVGAGCDPENERLQAYLRASGIGDRFHLLGLRRDTPRVMAALDVAVTASAYGEAFPLVVGEAMSCGVPCVVTDVGDCGAMVGNTGHLVPPRDAHALAEALVAVLRLSPDERRALGVAARERILDRYALSTIAGRYQQVYESLCD